MAPKARPWHIPIITLAAAALPQLALAAPADTPTHRVFFGNLHAHTAYSDGTGTPAQAYKHARDVAKVDFLAITEHNHPAIKPQGGGPAHGQPIGKRKDLYNGPQTSSLLRTAAKFDKPGRFVALYGQEWSTIGAGNHMNVFDAPEVIDSTQIANGDVRALLETWLPAHPDTTGGACIVQLNHPWTFPGNVSDPLTDEYGRNEWDAQAQWMQALDAHVELVAVMNGPSHDKKAADRPETVNTSEYYLMLNLGLHAAPTADQDNHFRTWGNASPARTAVIAETLDKTAVLAALRARHVYATEDRNLRVIIEVDGHLLGDIVDGHEFGELDIEVSIHDDDEPEADYEISVFVDQAGGGAARKLDTYVHSGNGETHIGDIAHDRKNQYFYFQITQGGQADDEHPHVDRVFTPPIWFEDGGAAAPSSGLDVSAAVASINSALYHLSASCRDAKRIKPANLVRGKDAVKGRRKHDGCPLE